MVGGNTNILSLNQSHHNASYPQRGALVEVGGASAMTTSILDTYISGRVPLSRLLERRETILPSEPAKQHPYLNKGCLLFFLDDRPVSLPIFGSGRQLSLASSV